MFVGEKIVYAEMPKTGSTFIDKVLLETVEGELIGKHDAPPKHLLDSERTVVGSIRNPFDWYVSLWAFGCKVKRKSGPYDKTTHWNPLRIKGYGLDKHFLAGIRGYTKNLVKGAFNDRKRWLAAYADGQDVTCFHDWCDLMFDRGNIYLYNSLLDQSKLGDFVGLQTFRYLFLYCHNRNELLTSACPSNYDQLVEWEKENCFSEFFILMENMTDGILNALQKSGYELSSDQTETILESQKANTTNRSRDFASYFKQKHANELYAREKFLFEKFGYELLKLPA